MFNGLTQCPRAFTRLVIEKAVVFSIHTSTALSLAFHLTMPTHNKRLNLTVFGALLYSEWPRIDFQLSDVPLSVSLAV